MTDNLLGASLDLDVIREKIPLHSSEKLCEMIICSRYFGFDPQICLLCMEELSKRRATGDTFDFEMHIETAGKDLPVLDFTSPDFRTILAHLTKK